MQPDLEAHAKPGLVELLRTCDSRSILREEFAHSSPKRRSNAAQKLCKSASSLQRRTAINSPSLRVFLSELRDDFLFEEEKSPKEGSGPQTLIDEKEVHTPATTYEDHGASEWGSSWNGSWEGHSWKDWRWGANQGWSHGWGDHSSWANWRAQGWESTQTQPTLDTLPSFESKDDVESTLRRPSTLDQIELENTPKAPEAEDIYEFGFDNGVYFNRCQRTDK